MPLGHTWGQWLQNAQVADIAAVAIMFPGALFAMAGGAIFGVPLGCALVWVGTAVGQTLAFIIGRWRPHCRTLSCAVHDRSWDAQVLHPRASQQSCT